MLTGIDKPENRINQYIRIPILPKGGLTILLYDKVNTPLYKALRKTEPLIYEGSVSVPALNAVSVERLERSTNGLKGRYPKNTSPIQCPAVLAQSSG